MDAAFSISTACLIKQRDTLKNENQADSKATAASR